jgi:maltooligosyltrehalose trehalohydrolase
MSIPSLENQTSSDKVDFIKAKLMPITRRQVRDHGMTIALEFPAAPQLRKFMKHRRHCIGAEVVPGEGTHFRVWAPKRSRVQVVVETAPGTSHAVELNSEADGYFSALDAAAPPGSVYRFRLDEDPTLYPDPASRFQPDGPHGPSEIVDARAFSWSDEAWRGIGREGQVIYEMHTGTFTQEGTWEAARRELPELAALGITVVELMPVADFPGKFGWGYDGVNMFAPTRLYGSPDDFRRFVDAAHTLNLGVILDVVYNHFGPDGNYLKQFADAYFTDRYANEWGDAINFDGPDAEPVRDFFLANAAYWIEEYHLDGLRLDATQQIFDSSTTHIIAEIARAVRTAAPQRRTYLVAENEPQQARLVRPSAAGGFGLDAMWNDDFHHSALVALTGRNEAYYTDYGGTPQEFISAAKWGFLYQGQRYSWQKARRGQPALDLEPTNFVSFIANHDQVANSSRGLRLQFRTSPGRYRAITALLLLGPATPMLFQGQEFGASSPFFYFADHHPELAKLVRDGRRKFLSQFASLVEFDELGQIPDPDSADTFARCKVNAQERRTNTEAVALHRDLLRLRREDPAFRSPKRRGVDGAVLGAEAFALRFFVEDGADRLLLVNFGRDLKLREVPEPLLAPPENTTWTMLWSSEAWRYGGSGHAALESEQDNWRIPGEAAVVLRPTGGK